MNIYIMLAQHWTLLYSSIQYTYRLKQFSSHKSYKICNLYAVTLFLNKTKEKNFDHMLLSVVQNF